MTIPRADSNVIILLLQPQGQRQRRTGVAGGVNTNEPLSCGNEPTAEKVSRSSIATLTPGVWIDDEIINYVDRVLIPLVFRVCIHAILDLQQKVKIRVLCKV